MKKLLSLALALVMILSLSVTALADETDPPVPETNILMEGNTVANRTYEAYMLMSATNADGSKFAYTVNEKYAAIMREVLGLNADADVDAITAKIAKFEDRGSDIRDFADEVYAAIIDAEMAPDATWTGSEYTVEQGYWLIADVTTNENLGNYQTRSLVMIDTIGDEKVTVKTKDEPIEDKKKTDDENDSLIHPDAESEDGTEINQDVADYDLGDLIPYSLFTKLPNNVTNYQYFVWMIKDTASKGLSFQEDTFEIKINTSTVYTQKNGEIAKVGSANAATAKFLYTITENADETNTLMVFPNYGYIRLDAEPVAGDDDMLTMPVTGPDNKNGGDIKQVIPEAAINHATVEFTYKAKLNEKAVVGGAGNKNTFNLIYSNDPHHDTFGETPDDINIILTWKVVVNKIDGKNSKPLEGADFELYKFIAKYAETEDEELIAKYEAEGCEHLNTANAWGTWKLVETKSKSGTPATETDAATVETVFGFSHVDDGFYKLVETKTPEGYNAIDPMIFGIKAHHLTGLNASAQIWETTKDDDEIQVSGELHATTSESNGTITMNIVNNAGAELPSTGGMGTTMLYIVGGLMVMFAVVMLVTKKRMSVDA